MSAVLRAPQIVPSLFAQGADSDDDTVQTPSLTRRLATCVAGLGRPLELGADTVVARYVPALAASSSLLIILGKPILKAASMAIGVDLHH